MAGDTRTRSGGTRLPSSGRASRTSRSATGSRSDGSAGTAIGACRAARASSCSASTSGAQPGTTRAVTRNRSTAPATALARIPDALSFVEAAPMGCAGVTTFNALRRTRGRGGRSGSRARHRRPRPSRRSVGEGDGLRDRRDRTGQQVRPRTPRSLARITTSTRPLSDVAAALQKLGGAAVVLATAANSAAIGQTVGGLGPARRTGDRRRDARSAADQPPGSDHWRAAGDRPSVGHVARRRGDDAFRGAVGGARRDRGAAAGAGRGGVYGAMDTGKARYRMVLTVDRDALQCRQACS